MKQMISLAEIRSIHVLSKFKGLVLKIFRKFKAYRRLDAIAAMIEPDAILKRVPMVVD